MDRLTIVMRTLENRHRFGNLISLVRRNGSLRCPNDFLLEFDSAHQSDVKMLYAFCVGYGVRLSGAEGCWHYADGILTTPEGISFHLSGFGPHVFAETFLYDTHFSDHDLKDKVVVQAGGFIGDTALYYAHRGAKVYSFEPDINSYRLALANLQLNPGLASQIVFKNWALGKDGEVDFPVNPLGSANTSLLAPKDHPRVRTRSVSIDTILRELSIDSPWLLDLDIKGNESDVIPDATISSFEMVRIEYDNNPKGGNLGSRSAIIDGLRAKGFKTFRIFKHNERVYDLMDHGTIEARK